MIWHRYLIHLSIYLSSVVIQSLSSEDVVNGSSMDLDVELPSMVAANFIGIDGTDNSHDPILQNDGDVTPQSDDTMSSWVSMGDVAKAFPILNNGSAVHDVHQQGSSRAITFFDLIGSFSYSSRQPVKVNTPPKISSLKRLSCTTRNTSDMEPRIVHIVNSTELLQQLSGNVLGARNITLSGHCTVVLFYAPWCAFCANIAPHYNALARAFPQLHVVAIDAFHFSNLNSRFGTIAVPNIMVFHNSKPIARFNHTARTLDSIAAFVANATGMQRDASVSVTPEDMLGPLSSIPSSDPDYLLWVSWFFFLLCCVVGFSRSAAGLRVWTALCALGHHDPHQHPHID